MSMALATNLGVSIGEPGLLGTDVPMKVRYTAPQRFLHTNDLTVNTLLTR